MKTKKLPEGQKESLESERRSEHPASHHKLYLAFFGCVLVLIFGVLLAWYYSGRALPNVTVGSVSVSNQSASAIRAAIAQQAPALQITFDDNGKKTTVPAKDLGVVVDVEATLQKTLQARRTQNIWQNLELWQTATIPLVLANDPGVLIDYAHQHFPSVFVDTKEPQVVFNSITNQFEVQAGQPGKGLDIKSFERALPDLALHPQGFTLKLTSQPVAPLLDASKLSQVRDNANAIIQQVVSFTLNGQSVYTAKPTEIASWMNFTEDASKGTVTLAIDKAKVQQFINDKVSPMVASPPADRKVVIDSSTGAQSVIQTGHPGTAIQGVDTLSDTVVSSLQSNKPITKEVSVSNAPFKTITISGSGKWIEVDVTRETATLWIGNQSIQTFLISSGRAATPTELGQFAIYSKKPIMTMTGTILGDYFYIPNIKWVSFFDGGEAFHGTYWHHNFGHPMSHGCINMTEADAKILYDFAPVGTKVVVHA